MNVIKYSLNVGTFGIKILLAFIVGGGALAASEWAVNQNASGDITVTSGSADLYICEPTGSTGDPDCPGDDSGADEIIFEGDEDMVPNSTRTWDIRLRNIGPLHWNVREVAFAISEVTDPGSDCDALPGFPVGGGTYSPPPGAPLLTALEPFTDDTTGNGGATWGPPIFFCCLNIGVHVAPGEFQDIRIATLMPPNLPLACQGNVWNMSLTFIVEPQQ